MVEEHFMDVRRLRKFQQFHGAAIESLQPIVSGSQDGQTFYLPDDERPVVIATDFLSYDNAKQSFRACLRRMYAHLPIPRKESITRWEDPFMDLMTVPPDDRMYAP